MAFAVGLLTLCWFLGALGHGMPKAFLPLGASMLGFLAAFLIISRLNAAARQTSARVLVLFGAVSSLLGLVAVAFRWYPIAIQSGSQWRLSSTLTYYNPAGLLLAMALLIAISLDQTLWTARVGVFLCAAGLLATQSRGALLALLIGMFLVPVAQIRRALLPLLVGLLAGLLVVVISDNDRLHVLVVLPVICGMVASVVVARNAKVKRWRIDTPRVVVGLLLVGLVAVGAWLLMHPALTRLHVPSNGDRVAIWAAALDQWRSSPITGVGPDHLLHVHYIVADGTEAIFAHNEYLQVLADSGVVGATLLVAVSVSIVRSVHRQSVLSSCAAAALVALAVAGVFDFDWHLPALGLIGGWVAGLAGRTRFEPERSG